MKLIPDWRRSWRFFSVQAMTVAGAVQIAWIALPEDMRATMPDSWLRYLTITLLVAGTIGRLVKQGEAKA